MTQQLQDIKIMLEQMYNVSTNIANRTDLSTGKKLTPVEIDKIKMVSAWAGLVSEQIEELLQNGFEEAAEEAEEAEEAELTPEQKHRIDFIAGMEKWVMDAPSASAFEKRQAYMVNWKAKNIQ